MNVVVLIEGREAIPVRAIPLLTNWGSMLPDVVAQVLAGNDGFFGFEGLQAYCLDDGTVRFISSAWWQRFCVRELKALSERLKSTHTGRETQHARWQDESLALLPAGAFVWKDEYTALHELNWAVRLRERKHTAWFNNRCESRNTEVDDAEEPAPMQKIAMQRVDEEFEAWRVLDFSPFISSSSRKNSVMEGFEPHVSTSPPAVTVEAAASQADSITSRQVATFFDGLPYSAENWPKRLSDTKWLQPAKIALGEVGGITGLWCPLILARLIHGREKGREQQKSLEILNSRFKRNPALQPWRDAWNEHYALFTDAIND